MGHPSSPAAANTKHESRDRLFSQPAGERCKLLRMIVTSNHGTVRELRMNRPPVNALNLELVAALRQAVERAPLDGVRALVVSGAPGRFSAGLDVPLLLGLDRGGIALLWREFYALLKALARSPIPIAAAITGHAPAGGTVLPLFCDWRVGADGDFKLGLSEVQVGLFCLR
jgi:3,2-trans-enoyl-CoA isomerase